MKGCECHNHSEEEASQPTWHACISAFSVQRSITVGWSNTGRQARHAAKCNVGLLRNPENETDESISTGFSRLSAHALERAAAIGRGLMTVRATGITFMTLLRFALGWAFWLSTCSTANAHRPFIEPAQTPGQVLECLQLEKAVPLGDPVRASVAVYGSLTSPDEIDVYRFTASSKARLPVEVLVPVRPSNRDFRPGLVVISRGDSPGDGSLLKLPDGLRQRVIPPPEETARRIFFEPFSLEKLYRGREALIDVEPAGVYYLVVFEKDHRTGDYALGVGEAEDFRDVPLGGTIRNVLAAKLGLVGGRRVPLLDLIGLFLFLAGFVVGLGAVTVIDLHGFLGRRSAYWTEATTRTHKVTKPLIWVGMATAAAGAAIYYRESGLSGVATFQAALAVVLVVNGLFLTLRVSPFLLAREREGRAGELLPASWQAKITVSFVVSLVGWWGSLFLLAWHIVFLR